MITEHGLTFDVSASIPHNHLSSTVGQLDLPIKCSNRLVTLRRRVEHNESTACDQHQGSAPRCEANLGIRRSEFVEH